MAFVLTNRTESRLPHLGSWLTLSDETVNLQDKVFDYDADIGFGTMAFIHAIRIEYTVGAVIAGGRTIEITIRDSENDDIRVLHLKGVTSNTVGITSIYEIACGLAPESIIVHRDTLPESFVLLPGQNMRVYPSLWSDASDDMEVHVLVQVF